MIAQNYPKHSVNSDSIDKSSQHAGNQPDRNRTIDYYYEFSQPASRCVVCCVANPGIIKIEKGVRKMFAQMTETAMTLLLSALMVVFFVLLAPVWTVFYSGVLLKDYLGAART